MGKQTLCIIMGGGCGALQSAAGALKAIDQQGISIDKYLAGGTGAYAAALHASGVSGNSICQGIKKIDIGQFHKFSLLGALSRLTGIGTSALYKHDALYDIFKTNINQKAADKVKVAVTNAKTLKGAMVAATPVTVLASAAIPQLFGTVRIGTQDFIAGGVANVIPVPKIKDIPGYKHIYIILCPDSIYKQQEKSFLNQIVSTLSIGQRRQVTQLYEQGWDQLQNVTVIQPKTDKLSILSWSKDFKIIHEAYQYTKSLLQEQTK